jgi:hypothetical protein
MFMMGDYWTEEIHPEKLPMPAREAWHRDAWDREQTELLLATQGKAYDRVPVHTPQLTAVLYDE